jgi:hypothetical protein
MVGLNMDIFKIIEPKLSYLWQMGKMILLILFIFPMHLLAQRCASYPSIYFQKNSTNYASNKGTWDTNFFTKSNWKDTLTPDTIKTLVFFVNDLKGYSPKNKEDSNYFVLITGYSNKSECKDTLLEYLRAKKVFDFLTTHGISQSLFKLRCLSSKKGLFPDHRSEREINQNNKEVNLQNVRLQWININNTK